MVIAKFMSEYAAIVLQRPLNLHAMDRVNVHSEKESSMRIHSLLIALIVMAGAPLNNGPLRQRQKLPRLMEEPGKLHIC